MPRILACNMRCPIMDDSARYQSGCLACYSIPGKTLIMVYDYAKPRMKVHLILTGPE